MPPRPASRTAAAVFGERGNREQERIGKYADAWKRLEGRDPQAEREVIRQAAIAEQQAKLRQEEKEPDRSNDQAGEVSVPHPKRKGRGL